MRGVLVTAVVCLGAGIGIFLCFCHGTTGVQFADSISEAAVHIDITTMGMAAILGVALSAVGAFLLIIATIMAVAAMFRRDRVSAPMKREKAFEE